MTDLTALWREDASADEYVAAMQSLVNSGDAWRLEGSVGRAAMSMIEAGVLMLGPEGHRDYYGNYVPGRDEVEPGTKGSRQFVLDNGNEPVEEGEDV